MYKTKTKAELSSESSAFFYATNAYIKPVASKINSTINMMCFLFMSNHSFSNYFVCALTKYSVTKASRCGLK